MIWIRERLADSRVRIYLAEAAGKPVGVARFEPADNGSSVISVALAPSARGQGLGSKLVEESTRMFARETACRSIHAYVKPVNIRSCRIFIQAGYVSDRDTEIRGETAYHFHWVGTP